MTKIVRGHQGKPKHRQKGKRELAREKLLDKMKDQTRGVFQRGGKKKNKKKKKFVFFLTAGQ